MRTSGARKITVSGLARDVRRRVVTARTSAKPEDLMPAQDNPLRGRYVIVVGVDFSDASADALQEAVRLTVGAHSAELHLVHVVQVATPSPTIAGPVSREEAYAEQIDQAGQTLKQWLDPLHEVRAWLAGHIRVGRPDREIAQVASDVGADLIVVGAHGKRGLQRLLLGSVSESLVRNAPCAVLAHRPRNAQAWELIEPPCGDCLVARSRTDRASLWCQRHSEHHVRAHTYHESPEPYGVGSQTFRS
jgi:nucleotide-binding universal stress UspA family protein